MTYRSDGMINIPEPEGNGVKEVYAFYGLAAYLGQVLEKGIVNMLVVFRSAGIPITQEQVDDLFVKYNRRTLGQLLQDARSLAAISLDVQKVLDEALMKRNRLIHHFFAEHSAAFMTESGSEEMIEELRGMAALFQEADNAIDSIYRPIMRRAGIDEEWIQREAEVLINDYLASKA